MAHNWLHSPLAQTIREAEDAAAHGRWQRAAERYSQALADHSAAQLDTEALAACYLNRGYALQKLGRFEEALQDCTKAQELNPRSFKPYLNAALIHARDLGRYEDALPLFDKALELSPICTEALASRGLTKLYLDDVEGAEADTRAALALDPRHLDALNNLGTVLVRRGELEQAADAFQRALEIEPHDAEIRVNLNLALRRLGADQAADSVLRKDKKAVRLWEERSGRMPRGSAALTLRFVRMSTLLYALGMCCTGVLVSGTAGGALVGALLGAVIGPVLGLVLAGYAKEHLRKEGSMAWLPPPWAVPSFPSPGSGAEAQTAMLGAGLGAVLGLAVGLIIRQLFGVADICPLLLGPGFGFVTEVTAVRWSFRTLTG